MPIQEAQPRRLTSRLKAVMERTERYWIDGRSRLIADTGLTQSALTRLLNGNCNPSYRSLVAVIEALERELGFRIDSRDVLSVTGEFPTERVCDLVRCRGCPDCKAFSGAGIPPRRADEGDDDLPAHQLTIP